MLVLYYHSNALYLSSVVQLSRFNRFQLILCRKLCHYITFFSVCQYLFEKFFKIFFVVFNFGFFVIAVRFAHNSLIISHSIPFVNTFLKSFLKSFFNLFFNLSDRQGCVLYIKPCSTQLDYYSTFEPICQHIFRKFFTFVALHYLTNLRVSKWLLCTKSLQKIQVSTSFTP